MITVAEALIYGLMAGAFNGILTRLSLKYAFGKSNFVFFGVYAVGFFYRLLFLIACIFLLRNQQYIVTITYMTTMLLVQVAFEVVRLKHHGIKRNS